MDNTQPKRWPLFLIGLLLFVLGPITYAVQCQLAYLYMTPWYLPALSSVGVALMIVSVWQRRGIVRSIALGVFTLLCGLQWLFFLVLARTPDYQGPAQVGSKVPTFAAILADGSPFTSRDLEADRGGATVLLFFRGHW